MTITIAELRKAIKQARHNYNRQMLRLRNGQSVAVLPAFWEQTERELREQLRRLEENSDAGS